MSDEWRSTFYPGPVGLAVLDGRLLLLYVNNDGWHLVLSKDAQFSGWDRLASGELPELVKPAEHTPL